MNPVFLITIIAVAFVFLVAFRGVKQNRCFKNADVKKFKEQIELAENIVILDVRTAAETAEGMIKGAVNIDVNSAAFNSEIVKLDKEKTYLVYCRSGMRSAKACNIMCEKGFVNLVNLSGGYGAWKGSGN
jgi:phage shock protein E